MSAQKKFERHRRTFCRAARAWLRPRRRWTLRTAWAECDRPSWMLYWLYMYGGVSASTLILDYRSRLGDHTFRSSMISSAICNEIRRTYTYTGKRRV